MNKLSGTIIQIEISGSMSIVQIDMGHDILMKTIIIETPDTAAYLKVGHGVKVLFKETEVVIGLGENIEVSLQNRLSGEIEAMETGKLISKLTISTKLGKLNAIISSSAVQQLSLTKGRSVTVLIKLNEVMLSS